MFKETIAADFISNAVYYTLIGSGSKSQVWTRGIILGVLAGLGGVYAPDPLGLKTSPTNRTNKTKVLTIAYYTIEGLVAAAVINSSKNKRLKK